MSKQYYIKELNQLVVIADKAFAFGGEGELYDILSPKNLNHCVAKVFHSKKRDAQKESKINYLIKNPPFFEGNPTESSVAWAKYLLHSESGEFMGFVMPKATGEKLEILTAPKLPKYLGKEWNRFRLGREEALRFRLKVCYNLATALRAIHATGKYVLVDLKPDNIIVQSNGLLSIVDIDSIEVVEQGKTIYPATVATPEYTPAEYYQGVQPGLALIQTSWDTFSMAVIFYRLLFGVHPYAATSAAPYDNVNALGDKIKHGLFVHNKEISNQFTAVPPPHQKFTNLDTNLQKLFLKTFVEGHTNPDIRPKAEDWAEAFLNNPLLLTNRSLPSKIVDLEATNKKNWYLLALEKSMAEQSLLQTEKKAKITITSPDYSSNNIVQEALIYYKKGGKILKTIAKNSSIILAGFVALLIVIMIISGSLSWLFYTLGALGVLFSFVLELLFNKSTLGLVFLMLLMPFIIITFKQFGAIIQNKTKNIRKKMPKILGVTATQKRKKLEELQYNLFNQRSKIKQRLREIKDELIVWNRIRIDKEKEFVDKNNYKIVESNKAIKVQFDNEKLEIHQQDIKAKKLILEEAEQIKKLQLDLQNKLNKIPYSDLEGKTIQQKITNLERLNQTNWNKVEINQLKANLKELDNNLNKDLQAIKSYFDTQHTTLQKNTEDHKIKIDDLINESVDTMRKKIKIDSALIDDSYKRLLKSINNLKLENNTRESELELLNNDIKELKKDLKALK